MTNVLSSNRVLIDGSLTPATIVIDNGKISEIRNERSEDANDLGDQVIMPGLIDSHVHINEPGRTAWEGFSSATKAAAAGGVTTLVDMPLNSSPVTTTVVAFEQKLEAAANQLYVDCGFYGGLVPDNQNHLEALIERGVLGIKAFLIDSGIDEFPPVGSPELKRAMPILARHEVPLLAHAELATNSEAAAMSDVRSPIEFARSRPEEWEANAIDLLLGLSGKFSCSVHIVHLAAASCLEKIRDARTSGSAVTVETCPHYLFFEMESIPEGSTLHKCAPPIRDRSNADALWDALVAGEIDFVVSDHSPSPPELKFLDEGDFSKAWGGIASLQLGLSVVWTLAQRRGCSITDVSRWMSTNPAQFVGLGDTKGVISPGYDADLVVFDPD